MGLAPFTLNINREYVQNRDIEKKPILKFIFSYLMIGCNLTIITFIIITLIMHAPNVIKERTEDDSPLSKSIEIHLMCNGNLTIIILLLFYLFRHRSMIHMANELIDIDMTVAKLPDDYQLQSGKIPVIIVFILNSFFSFLHIFERLFKTDDLATLPLFILPRTLFAYFILQYTIVLILIEKRYANINNAFIKLSKLTNQINYNCDNDFDNKLKVTINRTMVVEIIALKRAHASLGNLRLKIANFYSLGILFVTTYSTGSIIYAFYFIIMPFVRPKYYPPSVDNSIKFSFWLMKELFPIFLLAICANKTIAEMKKTSPIIYNILSQCKSSTEIIIEFKHFIFELLHNDCQFSAYNVFTVDSTIIRSILSSVVSNLIIFIQFQLDGIKMNEQHENNHANTTQFH
ncbi:hypothetical protein PV328_011529 [Microctonus aethiopoides]|uniref:Gustatory receptor n=1 Tax=Microctonus aethiopoides TaxID=144406 RepID=A0AA39C4P7_9HYME|nr:hypothetical protein PV328_011529 [Microctonus aethiopoides]